MRYAYSHARAKNSPNGILFSVLAIAAIASAMYFARSGGGGGNHIIPAAFANGHTIEVATAVAAEQSKPVLMFFTADWCGPCQKLKKTALANQQVSDTITSKTVPVLVDCSKAAPKEASTFSIEGYPTLLLVKDGKEIARSVGVSSADSLLAWLNSNAK